MVWLNLLILERSKGVLTIFHNRYISQHVITNLNHNVSGINHNIDELLVGVVTQIRLKQAAGQHKEKRTKMDKVRIVLDRTNLVQPSTFSKSVHSYFCNQHSCQTTQT